MVRVLVAGLLVIGSAATVALGVQVAQDLIEPAGGAPILGHGNGAAAQKGAGTFSPGISLMAAAEPKLVAQPVLVRGGDGGSRALAASGGDLATVYKDTTPILRPSSVAATRGGDRFERARQLQRELARVGCYAGDADGDWGGASKRAMAAFLERVNAVLPVDEPDPVLIALVQGHATMVCSDGCRPGEVLGHSGRCIPTGLVTARRDPAPPHTPASAWRTEVAAAPVEPIAQGVTPPLPGRMALGASAGEATTPDASQPLSAPAVLSPSTPKAAPPPVRKAKKSEPAWVRSVFPEVYMHR